MSEKKEGKDNYVSGKSMDVGTSYQTPGPNAYSLPPTVGYKDHDLSRWRNPAYTMGIKTEGVGKSIGPGPKYEIRDFTRYGKASPPKYTMRPVIKKLVPFSVPGPGTYFPEKCKILKGNKPPVYSFGVNAIRGPKGLGPGPNAYSLPTSVGMKNPAVKSNPAYSFGSDLPQKVTEKSPGPAAYGAPNLLVYKRKPPGIKIKERVSGGVVGYKPSPGPTAYNPQYNTRTHPPKYSFGIRHWDRSPPYVTKEDNMCY